MARTEKFTVAEVIEAIKRGITPTGAAKVLDCDPDTIRNYAKRHPTVKAALHAKRKELVDLAELGLRGALLNSEAWAIAFTLKTLGKDDGYTERHEQEISGKDGGPIETRDVTYNERQRADLIAALLERARTRDTGHDPE